MERYCQERTLGEELQQKRKRRILILLVEGRRGARLEEILVAAPEDFLSKETLHKRVKLHTLTIGTDETDALDVITVLIKTFQVIKNMHLKKRLSKKVHVHQHVYINS